MAPKNKKVVAKPYDRPIASSTVTRNGTIAGQSTTMGGGDIESTSMSSDFITMSSFNSLQQTVQKLAETIASLTDALKVSQPRGVDNTSDIDQPRGVDINQINTTDTDNISTDTVTTSIQNHLQVMMKNNTDVQDNGKIFTSVAMPVELNVTDKIKQKIWSGEYLDFNTLLDMDQPTEYTLKFVDGGDGSQINLAPAKNAKKVISVAQWCSVFNIFLVVYCKKYPQEISNLVTYQTKIRSLAQKGGDWQRYDTQFRKLKAQYTMSWELPHFELWVDCLHNPPKLVHTKPIKTGYRSFRPQKGQYNQTQTQSKSKFANLPKGVCYDFHGYGKCKREEECPYSHKCFTAGCGGPHSFSLCPKKGQNAGQYKSFNQNNKQQANTKNANSN
jgi:hypothetical protein